MGSNSRAMTRVAWPVEWTLWELQRLVREWPAEIRRVSDGPPQSLEQEMTGGGKRAGSGDETQNQIQLTGHGGMYDMLNLDNCIQGLSRWTCICVFVIKKRKKKTVDNHKLLSHIKNKLLSYLKMIHHFLHKRIAKMGIFFFASVSCPKTSFWNSSSLYLYALSSPAPLSTSALFHLTLFKSTVSSLHLLVPEDDIWLAFPWSLPMLFPLSDSPTHQQVFVSHQCTRWNRTGYSTSLHNMREWTTARVQIIPLNALTYS